MSHVRPNEKRYNIYKDEKMVEYKLSQNDTIKTILDFYRKLYKRYGLYHGEESAISTEESLRGIEADLRSKYTLDGVKFDFGNYKVRVEEF